VHAGAATILYYGEEAVNLARSRGQQWFAAIVIAIFGLHLGNRLWIHRDINSSAASGSTVLYEGINAHGELDPYELATRQGERCLRDRTAMLFWKQRFTLRRIQPRAEPSGLRRSRAGRRHGRRCLKCC
jgi:hypothetical protein